MYAGTDELSALSPVQTNEIIRKHLLNNHKAREAFIMSENSKKIPRALRCNVLTTTIFFSLLIQCTISQSEIHDGDDELKF